MNPPILTSKGKKYPPVIENIEDWPIYKLSEDREQFIKEIDEFTFKRLMRNSPDKLIDILAKTIYLERIRIKEEPWKVDPPNDRQFWSKTRKDLVRKSLDKEEEAALNSNKKILKKIISRYSEEIVGTFKIPTFFICQKIFNGLFSEDF